MRSLWLISISIVLVSCGGTFIGDSDLLDGNQSEVNPPSAQRVPSSDLTNHDGVPEGSEPKWTEADLAILENIQVMQIIPPRPFQMGDVVPLKLEGISKAGELINLTQMAAWRSEDINIAEVSNRDGDRGQLRFYRNAATNITARIGGAIAKIALKPLQFWTPRDSMSAVVHQDKLLLMGGWYNTTTRMADVWRTYDGNRWEKLRETAPWGSRNLAKALSFHGRIFLMGGYNGTRSLNDVWSSEEGAKWIGLNPAPWAHRAAFGSVVFKDRMWVLGGASFTVDNVISMNDVWSSSDGNFWQQEVEHAPWAERGLFDAVVFNGKIFVIGGGVYWSDKNFDDVWSSEDGINWTLEVEHAPWRARRFHRAVVFKNKIFVMAGVSQFGFNDADVWSSENGKDWVLVTEDAGWRPRHEPGLISWGDRMILLGGGWFEPYADIWSTTDGASWNQIR